MTAHATAEWPAQQLREAFPWDSAPRFLLRDRDRIFGADFTRQVKEFGIQEVLGAPRTPRQRSYIERVIGTIRRECLDHVIVFNEASLCRHLKLFVEYYHGTRTHLSLQKDTPESRSVQSPELGRVLAVPQVGGCIIATNVAPPEPRGDVEGSDSNADSCRGRFSEVAPDRSAHSV